MSERFQTTQLSLIGRLGNLADQEAWATFVEVYYPAILATLRRNGVQACDSEDVGQKVLLSVAKSLASRPHDPQIAMFRTWLQTVIRNAAINAIGRQPRDRGFGGDSANYFDSITAKDESLELDEIDYRKSLLERAAERIRGEYCVDVWASFWRTAIEGDSIEDVAECLGRSLGSIYAARSRVMKRLREEVQKIESEIDRLS